ncbi:MAG: ferritin family protein [Betaproteobacteria bacterium]
MSADPRNATAPGVPQTMAALMAQAWVMETEAAERYEELADAMETHNNREVAALFRRMAGYEAAHAQQILAEMGWTGAPPSMQVNWPDAEAPETTSAEVLHYLMQPWHALEIALAAEERAERFFAHLALEASAEPVRAAALALQAEEQEHVALVRAWMAKVPLPGPGWADDPDPPRYTD